MNMSRDDPSSQSINQWWRYIKRQDILVSMMMLYWEDESLCKRGDPITLMADKVIKLLWRKLRKSSHSMLILIDYPLR